MRTTLLVLAVALTAGACAAPGGDVDALGERIAALETEVGELGDAIRAQAPATDAADAEKNAFMLMLEDPQGIIDAILASTNALEQVDELAFDPATDTLVLRARSTGDAGEAGWRTAQSLAPLFAELEAFAPVLDLKVDDLRCICSTTIMKDIANQRADRAVWETVCEA